MYMKHVELIRDLLSLVKAYFLPLKSYKILNIRGAFDSAKSHKRQRRKRQSVTAKREKSQTPKFV